MEAYDQALMFLAIAEEFEDEELTDYIATQRINLKRLTSEIPYTPTAIELDRLNVIAQKEYPLAAYASGLYTIFTGDIVMPNIELYRPIENREIANISDEFQVMAYPSPATDNLIVKISGDYEHLYTVKLFDTNGKELIDERVKSGATSIDVSDLASGVYYLHAIKDESTEPHILKCMIID